MRFASDPEMPSAIRVPQDRFDGAVMLLLTALSGTRWFDARIARELLEDAARDELGLKGRQSSTADLKKLLTGPGGVDEILDEMYLRQLIEFVPPVGFGFTAHGEQQAQQAEVADSAQDLAPMRWHVAQMLTRIAAEGGGREARRTLVEAARTAGQATTNFGAQRTEMADQLLSALTALSFRIANQGHADLLPTVFTEMFPGAGRASFEDTLRAVVNVCDKRRWYKTSRFLTDSVPRLKQPEWPDELTAWIEAAPLTRELVTAGASDQRRAVVTMSDLLEAGIHFGHQTRRWNPKMKRFIFEERNGLYIIDLRQTLGRIETAYTFVRDLVAEGGTVLFIGTKRQAQDPIQSYAEKVGMPYINQRWLGGMLTNFETIRKRVAKMQEYRHMRASGEFDVMPKKEALLLSRELAKLERNLGGIANMRRLPDAVFIFDTKKEHIGVTEANKLGIPIIAVVDTNCDPDVIQYVIPSNDESIRAGELMCRVMTDAVAEGKFIAAHRTTPELEAELEARIGGDPRQPTRAQRRRPLAAEPEDERPDGRPVWVIEAEQPDEQ